MPELILAQKAGLTGENVFFSSNETPESEYVYANLMGAIINLDDITHIDYLDKALGGPPGGLNIRWPDQPLDQEARLHRYKLDAARAFCRANGLRNNFV